MCATCWVGVSILAGVCGRVINLGRLFVYSACRWVQLQGVFGSYKGYYGFGGVSGREGLNFRFTPIFESGFRVTRDVCLCVCIS